jgi:hypothetical protein
VPTLLSAVPGHSEATLTWSDEHTGTDVTGYTVYYDQAGKSQFIESVGLVTSYLDTGLTNGQEYCYMVTATTASCESGFSNVLCAIPNAQGQLQAGVSQLLTGRYEKTGKGKNQTIVFVEATDFSAGNTVVLRAQVVDGDTGLPLANAVVTMDIAGPEATVLTSSPSGGDGIAEAQWTTQAPGKKGKPGTTPGTYTATVTSLTLAGYDWDGVPIQVSFTIL